MFTIEEVCFCTHGKLLSGDAKLRMKGVSTDTRTLRPGALFVALKGKNFDGHKFVQIAVAKKARALLVSDKASLPKASIPVILVSDTLKAYCALARYHRERFSIPVIALTGSAGKTTTKELLAQVLSQRFRLLKNFQTENNEIGVAKTLLQLRKSHELAILEFGTNHFGEIERLTRMGQPTMVLLTNIGDSHLEFLKSRQGVFREKSGIFRYSSRLKDIFYNADDVWLKKIGSKYKNASATTFSINKKSHYQARKIMLSGFLLSFSVGKENFCLKISSRDNIYNALAAIAFGKRFHITSALIKRSLQQVKFPQGRQNVLKVNGRWIIDDTYNANPTSVASALRSLELFPAKGKKFFVFGDMRELGKASRRAHQAIGALSAGCGVDMLLTYGSWSKLTISEAGKKGIPGCHCISYEEIVKHLVHQTLPGDVILIKGSRGMRMESVIEKLRACHF